MFMVLNEIDHIFITAVVTQKGHLLVNIYDFDHKALLLFQFV